MTEAEKVLCELVDAFDADLSLASGFNGRLVAKAKRHAWALRQGMQPPKENN